MNQEQLQAIRERHSRYNAQYHFMLGDSKVSDLYDLPANQAGEDLSALIKYALYGDLDINRPYIIITESISNTIRVVRPVTGYEEPRIYFLNRLSGWSRARLQRILEQSRITLYHGSTVYENKHN